MFIYKFEKGTIKTGVKFNLGEDNQFVFEDDYGKLLEFYNDKQHTDEELEFHHGFIGVDDESDKVIFSKDKKQIDDMSKVGNRFIRASIYEIENMANENKLINIVTEEGYHTWTDETYIDRNGVNRHCNYIHVSWI